MPTIGKFTDTLGKIDVPDFVPQWLPHCVASAQPDAVALFDPGWLNNVYSDGSNYGSGGCPNYFIVDFQGVYGYPILFAADLQSPAAHEGICSLLIGETLIMVQSINTGEWSVHAHHIYDFIWKGKHCEPPQAIDQAPSTPTDAYTIRVAARISIKGFFVKPPLEIGALYWPSAAAA